RPNWTSLSHREPFVAYICYYIYYPTRMTSPFRLRKLVLFAGDLVFFVFGLWLSLFLRAFEVPTRELFLTHLVPFCALFLLWAFIFFIAGLYESRSIVLARRALSTTLLVAQTINIVLAAVFFF